MDKLHSELLEKVVQAMKHACKSPGTDTLSNAGYVMAEAAINAVIENERCSVCGYHLHAPTLCDICVNLED